MTSNALTYKIMPVEKTAQEWRNWQTRRLQVPVTARPCGFKSHLLHKRRGITFVIPLLLCRSDLEPVEKCLKWSQGTESWDHFPTGSRSPRHKRLVGPLGGKKVHRTFFFFRLAPSPARRRILEPVGSRSPTNNGPWGRSHGTIFPRVQGLLATSASPHLLLNRCGSSFLMQEMGHYAKLC